MVIRTFTLTLRNPQIYFDRRLFLHYITAIFKLSKRYYTYTLLNDPTTNWYCEGSFTKFRFSIYIHPRPGSLVFSHRSKLRSSRRSFTARRAPLSLPGVRRRRFGARRTLSGR